MSTAAALQQAILDSANYSIISTTPTGIITTFNAAAARWLGYTPAEVINQMTPAIFHDAAEIQQRSRELSAELGRVIEPGFEVFVAKAREGKADEREWTYIRKDGSRFSVSLSVTAVRNPQGELVGFLGIGSDISDRIEAVQQRQQAEVALQQQTQALATFSTQLKHLHRINTTDYATVEALFADCLTTGGAILQMPTGIISQVVDQTYIIRAVQSELTFLQPGLEFLLAETYCAAVVRQKRTVTYQHVGAQREMQSHPVYQNLRLEAYLGAPIFVNGEVYGTLNFSSTEIRQTPFTPHEREIIELMAQSIGRFIAANQASQAQQQAAIALRRQNRRSQLFAELALKVRQSLKLETILQTTVTEVQQFLQADRVLIFQLRPDQSGGTVLQEAVVSGWPMILGEEIDDPCFESDFLEQYRQGRVGQIEDVETTGVDACYLEMLQSFGVKANLVVPILQSETLWGLLIAHQCSRPRQWTTFEIDLLQQLANQVGIALAQSQLVAALRESEARFRTLADSAPVLLWMSGTDQQCSFFNQGWLDFTGRSLAQELGNGWTAGVYAEDLAICLDAYQQAFAARQPFQVEYRLRRFDGQYRWVLNTGVPRFTPAGLFEGYIGSCIDISDRREIERLKDEFVSVVSHELRTPLTSISGALDLLAGGVLSAQPQQAQRMLNIAAANAERLIRLINDILDIERIESGRVVMQRQTCDAAQLIATALDLVQSMASQAQVTLVSQPLTLPLSADPDRILQVLTNLLSNAIKFSEPGGTVWLEANLISQREAVRREKEGEQNRESQPTELETAWDNSSLPPSPHPPIPPSPYLPLSPSL
ncbi:MAG: GAF domain-containing protein, partial [Almyronema sp.]